MTVPSALTAISSALKRFSVFLIANHAADNKTYDHYNDRSRYNCSHKIILLVFRRKMRLPLQEQRIFLLVFRRKMRLPLQEQRIFLLVFRRKMRAHWRAEYFPPCFSKKNATAFAGAEDFSPCFADFCGSGSDFSTATSTQNLIFTYLPLLSENLYTSNNRSP